MFVTIAPQLQGWMNVVSARDTKNELRLLKRKRIYHEEKQTLYANNPCKLARTNHQLEAVNKKIKELDPNDVPKPSQGTKTQEVCQQLMLEANTFNRWGGL